jgi:GTPase SAR1 family protein
MSWGVKNVVSKVSKFFDGISMPNFMRKNLYGVYEDKINEFCPEEQRKDYDLPSIIVIGDESSGKSSLLENIIKCPVFPRDQTFCTKCPVHLSLTTGAACYSVSFRGETKECKDSKDILPAVKRYMATIEGENVIDDEIHVKFQSEEVYRLEMYDLPGIRAYPETLAQKITTMYRKYLGMPNTIVICVAPATQPRLTASRSISMVLNMNLQQKCILVLTLIDRLMPENIEELLISRVLNLSDEVRGLNFYGINGVINRVHTDRHTLQENDANEARWYEEHIFRDMPAEYAKKKREIHTNLSVFNLITKINKLMEVFIDTYWKPRFVETIKRNVDNIEKQIADIGPKLESEEIRRAVVENMDIETVLKRLTFSNVKDPRCDENDDGFEEYVIYDWYKDYIQSVLDVLREGNFIKRLLCTVFHSIVKAKKPTEIISQKVIDMKLYRYENYRRDFYTAFIETYDELNAEWMKTHSNPSDILLYYKEKQGTKILFNSSLLLFDSHVMCSYYYEVVLPAVKEACSINADCTESEECQALRVQLNEKLNRTKKACEEIASIKVKA